MITYWLFIANSVHCFLKQRYLYGIAFMFLVLTSHIVYSAKDDSLYFYKWIADQFAIFFIVIIGGYNSLKIGWLYLILAVLSVMIVLAIRILMSYDHTFLIHVLSSFGHHVIMLGT